MIYEYQKGWWVATWEIKGRRFWGAGATREQAIINANNS